MRKLPDPLKVRGAPGERTFDNIRIAPEGGLYVFEHVLFDTVLYPAAGAANLELAIFGDAAAARAGDRTLTNWPASGALQTSHRFHGLLLYMTPQTETAISADAGGRVRDVDRIVNTARGILEFSLTATGRRRPGIPLRALPSLPGQRSAIVIAPSNVAAEPTKIVQSVQQIGSGDGYPFDLPLNGGEAFALTARFGPAAVAISADLQIQFSIYGWQYQPAG